MISNEQANAARNKAEFHAINADRNRSYDEIEQAIAENPVKHESLARFQKKRKRANEVLGKWAGQPTGHAPCGVV